MRWVQGCAKENFFFRHERGQKAHERRNESKDFIKKLFDNHISPFNYNSKLFNKIVWCRNKSIRKFLADNRFRRSDMISFAVLNNRSLSTDEAGNEQNFRAKTSKFGNFPLLT
jgi:hypothetical protein